MNSLKFKNIKLLKNIKRIFLVSLLIGGFIGITFLGYIEKNNIKVKQDKIEYCKANNSKKIEKKYTYNDILQYISDEADVEIKKINKEGGKTNKKVNLELEYKGDIEKFNNFLKSIHKKENFYCIENIKINLIGNNNINSLFTCKFYI